MTPTTAEEWLDWFEAEEAREPHEWRLRADFGHRHSIRWGNCCPLTAAAGVTACIVPDMDGLKGVTEMPWKERRRIACAADDDRLQKEPALRARLLEICRLEER